MLPVVLVVQDQLDRGEALLEQAVLGHALGRAAVGIAAPGDVGAREVGIAFPAALVDQRLQPGAVRSRLGAEHAKARAAPGELGRRRPAPPEPARRPGRARRSGSAPRARRAPRPPAPRVEQRDLRREGIAEKPGDAQRDVNAGAVEQAERQDLDAGNPVRGAVPQRARAEQGERLGEVVAAGAHVGGAPGRQRHRARPVAVLLNVALDQQRRRPPAEMPGGRGWHGARVDREEVAPGRQHVRTAAGRRAARSGLDEPALERSAARM